MAVTRYDQRKYLEEQEANAIGTEYARADLLPAAEAKKARTLLASYLEQRILYYSNRNEKVLRQINRQTSQLQLEMWSAVTGPALAQPTPVTALVVVGMNDVLNSQGYTQAGWWNRVPAPAWTLLITIAIFCNFLVGRGASRKSTLRFLILPVVLSISLFLIADIGSPRSGVIHVNPQNLKSIYGPLHSQ